ncbi:MAG: hypothetical protein DWG76_04180 [Chloroflexi bacterium]|nr:hypothetical protein [Chloroflexota bacterium]MQC26634.1 hypothetical protein [Chloroflexota bacterium]
MNAAMEKQFALLKLYQPMRAEVMDALKDRDLGFKPENSPSVADLCVQIGEWQQSYIDGFKTFSQDFDYRNNYPELRTSVEKLKSWYAELDAELEATLEGLSDEDVENKVIDRGGWSASPEWSLRIFQECLIIFYSKMWVYFNLMGREQPEGLRKWIS